MDPLEALGDATRRAIVVRLRDGERTVGDLAAGLPVSRPAVSQHLGVLRAAGLVLERPSGTRRFYRLDPAALVAIHARVDAMWGMGADRASLEAAQEAAPGVAASPAAPTGPAVSAGVGSPERARPVEAAAPADAGKGGHKKHKKKGGRR